LANEKCIKANGLALNAVPKSRNCPLNQMVTAPSTVAIVIAMKEEAPAEAEEDDNNKKDRSKEKAPPPAGGGAFCITSYIHFSEGIVINIL